MGITQTLELALQDIIEAQVASCLNERLRALITTEVIQEWGLREADLINNDRVLAQRMDHLEKHLAGLDDRYEADHQNLDLRIKAALKAHSEDVENIWKNIGKLSADLDNLRKVVLPLTTSSPTPYTVPEEVRSLDERVCNLESEMVTVRNHQEHLAAQIKTNYSLQKEALHDLTCFVNNRLAGLNEDIKSIWENDLESLVDKKIDDHWETALDSQDLSDTISIAIDEKVEKSLESGFMLTNLVKDVLKNELELKIVID